MNILHLTTYLQGGAGRIIYDLMIRQKQFGHNVFLITSDTEYPGYCNYQEYFDGFEVREILYCKVDSLFKRDKEMNEFVINVAAEWIHKFSIDVIHCHAAVPAYIALNARFINNSAVPVIQTMHGWGINKTAEHEKQDRIIMNQLDLVVPVSRSSEKILITKDIDPDLIQVVYPSVGRPSSLAGDDPDFSYVQTLRAEKKIIGCIGSVCPRKNQRLLVEAFSLLKEEMPLAHCLFIGEGKDVALLTALVEQRNIADSVTFLGYKKNADMFIPLCDILCLPSLAEGLPVTVLEGFRDRTLVVGGDIPEIAEAVIDGETGLLFKSNNAVSLADTIAQALLLSDESRRTIIDAAYSLYSKAFTFDAMAEKYETLYTNLVNSRHKSTRLAKVISPYE